MSNSKELVTSKQLNLDLCIEKEVEINGIGMGVLSDGTPYLTGRGLARVCGIVQNAIVELTNSWSHVPSRPREAKIKEILRKQGLEFGAPFIPIERDGKIHYAYPDTVCMAVLEYYAFEAGANCKPQAQHNYRLLARNTFREFIYRSVGYDPRHASAAVRSIAGVDTSSLADYLAIEGLKSFINSDLILAETRDSK